jgi:inosine/xanthosine triphosphate pyrophosphatase family protein
MPPPPRLNPGAPILLGTSNPDKQAALRWLLEGLPLTPVTSSELGLGPIPDEAGDTHEAIARAKAWDWARAASGSASTLAIASDGGLVLPALGPNWESRYTHRFAGPEADNARRIEYLLELMQPYHGPERAASWVEAVAIASQDSVVDSWQVNGATGVISDGRGVAPPQSGFWAFSVWYFPQFDKTYGQLSMEEREALGDHWVSLRGLVQGRLHSMLALDG